MHDDPKKAQDKGSEITSLSFRSGLTYFGLTVRLGGSQRFSPRITSSLPGRRVHSRALAVRVHLASGLNYAPSPLAGGEEHCHELSRLVSWRARCVLLVAAGNPSKPARTLAPPSERASPAVILGVPRNPRNLRRAQSVPPWVLAWFYLIFICLSRSLLKCIVFGKSEDLHTS